MATQTVERAPTADVVSRAKPPQTESPNLKKCRELINKDPQQTIWVLIRGYLGVNFLMFLRFFFPRALFEPSTIANIGFPFCFQPGVNQQFLQSNRIWVVLEPGRLFMIFARCTHLCCTPHWLPQEDMFQSTCHESEYDPNGVNCAGPPPRPMDRRHANLLANGTVLVHSSRPYMQDPRAGSNQFNNPGSLITI